MSECNNNYIPKLKSILRFHERNKFKGHNELNFDHSNETQANTAIAILTAKRAPLCNISN